MLADLHCHTKLSDGSLGLEDIISLAAKKGVDTISVTDCDCTAGAARAKVIGQRKNVNVIPGVQITATDPQTGNNMHILAYLCDAPDRLAGLCQRNSLIRKRAAMVMISRVCDRYPVTPELVQRCATGSTNIYVPHIMQSLVECGLDNRLFGDLYEKLFTPDSPESVLVNARYTDVYRVLEEIDNAGGVSVLANPIADGCADRIADLAENGLCGVQAWHPDMTANDTDALLSVAKKNKLLAVGGTDFRGMYSDSIVSVGDVGTPKTQLNELLNFKTKKKRMLKKQAEGTV